MKHIGLIISLLLSITACSQDEKKATNKTIFSYDHAFEIIKEMLVKDELSFKEAVFLVENAYLEDRISADWFNQKIAGLAFLTEQQKLNINLDYELGDKEKVKNFAALFSVIKDTTIIYKQSDTLIHLPFAYDFNDMFGEKEWANMFVSKLLVTRKGNCHSLPYLYKIIANKMGIGDDTYLALSPNHTYIKHHSQKVGFYNTELTSGFFPQDAWLKASGYIPLIAIQNGIFLVALTEKESVSMCLYDLAMGYDKKFPDNDGSFIIKCCDTVLEHFPHFIKALLLKAETYTRLWKQEANKESQKAKDLWNKMDALYTKIHELGYRQMPKEMYVQWLTEVEKAKYDNQNVPRIK